jgi:hypothetical protein
VKLSISRERHAWNFFLPVRTLELIHIEMPAYMLDENRALQEKLLSIDSSMTTTPTAS